MYDDVTATSDSNKVYAKEVIDLLRSRNLSIYQAQDALKKAALMLDNAIGNLKFQ